MIGWGPLADWTGPTLDGDAPDPVEREGIRVGPADEGSLDAWDERVGRSPQGTAFHRLAALRVQADHSGTDLVPLVGHKGQEPVGVFPVFVGSKAGFAAAFSPAPGLWISSLGPALLNVSGLKQRRAEARNRRFVGAALEWLERAVAPGYVHVSSDRRYVDPRPFEWNDFAVTPRYTYVVDLTLGPESLLEAFSSDARRNVSDGRDDYRITVGGREAIRHVVERVRDRYEQQDESYTVTPEFVVDLHDRLPDGTVKPYACWSDGEFLGGMVVLAHGDTVYRWQGGAKVDGDLPVNDLLDWRIIRDAAAAGYERYDLEGANERRLCEYKAKFAPDVATYYRMERGDLWARLGARVYTKFFR
jgi:hypothetical protein